MKIEGKIIAEDNEDVTVYQDKNHSIKKIEIEKMNYPKPNPGTVTTITDEGDQFIHYS